MSVAIERERGGWTAATVICRVLFVSSASVTRFVASAVTVKVSVLAERGSCKETLTAAPGPRLETEAYWVPARPERPM